MNSKLTQYAFFAGAIYFVFMAIAHFMGIKVPVLFVYYDTPFYAYQDKIISFAVSAYIALFYGASQHREIAAYAIFVMVVTTLGLSFVNLSDDLQSVMNERQTTIPYWVQTGMIGIFTMVLALLYFKDSRDIGAQGKGELS